MANKYAELTFTDNVRQLQEEMGSRAAYRIDEQGEDFNHRLTEREMDFIADRDSFYIASVSATGWPYLQHRGGPRGVMRVLNEHTLGFADFRGNRQYLTAGNLRSNDRVALFFMDYPNARRLKLSGRVREVAADDWQTQAGLEVQGYRARVERYLLIQVVAFDWNCPQHITPRYSGAELEQLALQNLELES
jgi:hypothetical protein